MPSILVTPNGWITAPTGGGGTGGGGTGGGGTGGGGGTSVAPAKELWQPAQIASNAAGTQVGPNGQYSLNPFDPSVTSGPTALTKRTGNLTLNTSNVTWIGIDFFGSVTNGSATNNIFYSCRFRGDQSSAGAGLVSNFNSGTITIYDSWFDPTKVNTGNSVVGCNYTLWRCEAWRTTDGFGPRNITGGANANTYHYNCYVHDLCANLTDGGHNRNGSPPGPSHNDCVQHQGGNNCEVIGCTLMGFCDKTYGDGPGWNAGTSDSGTSTDNNVREFGPNYQINSCLQTNQNNGKAILSGCKFSHNYCDGGIFSLNFANGNGAYAKTHYDEVVGNRFGHNQGGFPGNSKLSRNNGGTNTWCFNGGTSVASIGTISDNLYADTLTGVNTEGY